MGITYGGAKRIGESGTLTLSDSIDGGVVETVTFSTYYKDPVVFAFMTTNNDIRAAQARVSNVTRNSCNIFFQRDDGLSHGSSEDVSYLVMEKGVHRLAEGGYVEVGSIETDALFSATGSSLGGVNTSETINLTHQFTNSPSVIHSLNTNNNEAFMSTLAGSVSTSSFIIRQNRLETASTVQVEKIAWMAITTGVFDHYESEILGNAFSHGTLAINFSNTYSTNPDIIVKGITIDGGDGYFMRGAGNLSTSSISVFTEEDQINDSETGHTTEAPVYIAMKSGSIFYEDYRLNGILN